MVVNRWQLLLQMSMKYYCLVLVSQITLHQFFDILIAMDIHSTPSLRALLEHIFPGKAFQVDKYSQQRESFQK